MALSDTSIRSVKPCEKAQKLSDGGGLHLYISQTGGKLWRMAYRFNGKQKTLSFGAYPAVSLKDARYKRDEAKALLAKGIDPAEQKKQAKVAAMEEARAQTITFEYVAREWHDKKTAHLTEDYRKQILSRLEKMLFPHIGTMPFAALEPANILGAVRPAEERGAIETAHKLVNLAGQVCRYARLVGYAKYDVAAGLTEALPSVQTKHLAAIIEPEKVGHLLQAIDAYQGDASISYAMRILPYVFVRSSEIRGANWTEINFDAAEWIIPAGRMKMKKPHVVPLAKQVVSLFIALREYSGGGTLVFPSPFSATRCISDMGLLNALRRMGYIKGEMTIHGFRGMASTLLNEQGYRADVIEAQLAHGERNAVRKAYNHAEYLPERRKMMQEWADYLNELREQSNRACPANCKTTERG